MKNKLFLGLVFISSILMLSSCKSKEGDDLVGIGLTGYYTDLSRVANASDFDEINQAINNNELLYVFDHRLGEDDYYYATYDLFIDKNIGAWNESEHHHGRFRFYLLNKHKASIYPVIHIIDDTTIAMQGMSCFIYKEGWGDGEPLYKFYAGPIFGNMEYVGHSSSWMYYTYTYVGLNKIVVSNGDIYTIADGGLIQEGTSVKLSKYNPTKLHK
jgi:hypothetical protein